MSSVAFVAAAYLLANLVAQPNLNSQTDKAFAAQDNTAPVQLQKYGGDPKGPDPHGDDPHDEQHDSNLPANKERNSNKAPKDVYGDQYPNGRAPY